MNACTQAVAELPTDRSPEDSAQPSPSLRPRTRVRTLASRLGTLGLLSLAGLALSLPVAAQQVVARIRTQVPQEPEFLLRATVPLPRGTWQVDDPAQPLRVIDADGTAAETQVEVVSRYPADADGVDIAQVIARVQRPDGATPGDFVSYDVRHEPHSGGSFSLHPDVETAAYTPDAFRLTSRDVFGHHYGHDPLEDIRSGGPSLKILRDGQILRQFRTHGPLLPVQSVGGATPTMPHMMGVLAYVTFYEDKPFFSFDLHVHNGLDGQDSSVTADDVLDKLYFSNLNLSMPAGWNLVAAFDNPMLGPQHHSPTARSRQIVRRLADDRLHLMPRQSHFVRRMMIATDDGRLEAKQLLEEWGLGFCLPGNSGGQPLWSWWNPETARYFPMKHMLPRLDSLGLGSIRQTLHQRFESVRDQVATGDSGGYPFLSAALGWSHPWGITYGGMSGGDEIHFIDGVRTLSSRSREGYRLQQLISKAYVERQPTVLRALDGSPTTLEDILVDDIPGSAPYSPTLFSMHPNKVQDYFGFESVSDVHAVAAQERDQQPGYEELLLDFLPIDHQHQTRYTRTLKSLMYIGNDAVAKDELEITAELYRLSYHTYQNSPWGHVQGGGLLDSMEFVAQYPGTGFEFRRNNAWGIDSALCAYAAGDDELRDNFYPWFENIVGVLEDGQSTCTGNIMSSVVWTELGGRYRLRKSPEVGMVDQILRGMKESVFRGVDGARSQSLDNILVASVTASISPPFWSDTHHAPYHTVAAGTSDADIFPDLCTNVPDSAHHDQYDGSMYWCSLAYAYEVTGNQVFLNKARELAGVTDLMEMWDVDSHQDLDIEKRHALLALIQTLP